MNMNQVKRQSSLSEFLNTEAKKIRTTNDDKKLITSIENLSNEVFYEIFDYLDGRDIYDAFSNLNSRIQQLITSPSLILKIEFFRSSHPDMKHRCEYVIIPNKHRIISLLIWDQVLIDQFFIHCIIDETFIRLESICLCEVSINKLIIILFYLKSLPRLFALTIFLHNDDSYIDLSDIYRMILCLPSLKYNKLFRAEECEVNVLVPFAINERFSNIEYLHMNHRCNLNEIISILYHTPRLHHLICGELFGPDDNIENEVLLTLPNLTNIKIYDCYMKFNEFEKFSKKICRQLKDLYIGIYHNDNYIGPAHWERLILQYIPHLLRFHLHCRLCVDDYFEDIGFDAFVNQLTSRFWIDHGWVFGLTFNAGKIFYETEPYSRPWFSFDDNAAVITYSNQDTCHDLIQHTTCCSRRNTGISSIQFSQTIELSIWDHIDAEPTASIIDKFNPLLLAMKFNSLKIYFKETSICTFLKLIRLLPNLDSLEVSCFLPLQLNKLPVEDIANLHLTSINNKITKVRQMMDFDLEQVHFLIVLCPHMQHFEMVFVEGKDFEPFVRFILMKTTTDIPYLHLLRLFFGRLAKTNDEMVQKLRTTIDSQKLLSNYIIKRSRNSISLQWMLQ